MQTTTKIAATGGAALAACAACCAVSIVPAAVAGAGFAAVGGAVATWGIPALLLAVPFGIYLMTRKPSASRGVPANSAVRAPLSGCGCGAARGTTKEEPTVACTLDAVDFKARTASIRDLARRELLKSLRVGLTLSLVYSADASDEVAELVAKERACCAFLDFDMTTSADGVHLVIIAPESAAEAADMLFDHFAPDLARSNEQKESA